MDFHKHYCINCKAEKARNIRHLRCDRDRVGVCGLSVDDCTP
jgi:hypothetical protein